MSSQPPTKSISSQRQQQPAFPVQANSANESHVTRNVSDQTTTTVTAGTRPPPYSSLSTSALAKYDRSNPTSVVDNKRDEAAKTEAMARTLVASMTNSATANLSDASRKNASSAASPTAATVSATPMPSSVNGHSSSHPLVERMTTTTQQTLPSTVAVSQSSDLRDDMDSPTTALQAVRDVDGVQLWRHHHRLSPDQNSLSTRQYWTFSIVAMSIHQ